MNHHVLPCFAIHERFQDFFTETATYRVPSTALEIARSLLLSLVCGSQHDYLQQPDIRPMI